MHLGDQLIARSRRQRLEAVDGVQLIGDMAQPGPQITLRRLALGLIDVARLVIECGCV
jgi:hypothetical protein